MKRIVSYLRVSTQRQRRSGLGIEAQRAAIARFAEAEGLAIIAEYVEAETGKGADALDRRAQLAAALAAARSAKCAALVAKHDRLSRDVAFVAGLTAQRVPFLVAELAATPIRSCSAQAALLGRSTQAAAADQFVANLLPAIDAIRSTGATTLEAMTQALNQRGIRSSRDGRWHASSVADLITRTKNVVG